MKVGWVRCESFRIACDDFDVLLDALVEIDVDLRGGKSQA